MNCKPGDLAVVIRCADAPQNIGCIVEVMCAAGPCPCGCTERKPFWHCRTKGRLFVAFGGFLNSRVECTEADIADSSLRPLKGDEGVDEVLRAVGAPAGLVGIPADEVAS